MKNTKNMKEKPQNKKEANFSKRVSKEVEERLNFAPKTMKEASEKRPQSGKGI